MPVFLSDEWISDLRTACGNTPAGAAAPVLVLEPVVTGVPGRGEVRYRIVFADGTCTVTSAAGSAVPEGSAHVRLETDYVTAVALARGTANAQAALADGRMQVSGDIARLAGGASALTRLEDLFGAVRASTTYPAP